MFKLRTFRLTALILSATAFAWSCGDIGNSPTGNEPVMTYEEAVAAYQAEPKIAPSPTAGSIVFSPRAVAAAKRLRHVPENGINVVEEEIIDNRRGGKIDIKIRDYGDDSIVRLKSAKLEVDKGSISLGDDFTLESDDWVRGSKYKIVMSAASGTELEHIAVAFDPDGMEFSPGAKLTVEIEGRFSVGNLVAYHVSADGKVSKARVRIEKRRGGYRIVTEVLGFSEYSWDDDDITDDDPCAHPDSGCWGY